jgi:hypothetical protein
MAGFLIYRPLLLTAFPGFKTLVALVVSNSWITVAGTTPDLHRIPS